MLCPHCSREVRGTSGLQRHRPNCPGLRQQHTQNVQAVLTHEQQVQNQANALEEARVAFEAAEAAKADALMRDPTPPPPTHSTLERPRRSARARQRPRRYRDEPPEPPAPAETAPLSSTNSDGPGDAPQDEQQETPSSHGQTWYRTPPNIHGVYKVYPQRPTHDPDNSTTLNDLCHSSQLLRPETEPLHIPELPAYFPFTNYSAAWLMTWFLNTPKLNLATLKTLVDKVFRRSTFSTDEIVDDFDPNRELHRVDEAAKKMPDDLPKGWKKGLVKIKLPPPPGHPTLEADAPEVEIGDILYRPLEDTLQEAFQGAAFNAMHTTPFSMRWDPNYDVANPDIAMETADPKLDDFGLPELPEGHQEVYGETYTSPAMLGPHCKLPTEPGIESVVAGFMFFSDATHLANFGTASLWPLYTFFANHSKYLRCKPTAHAGYHQAYFPSVPEWVKDKYKEHYNVPMPSDTHTHVKRELMHAVWDQLLLTPEFIHLYLRGWRIRCIDGVWRLVFPRFITYGADYPEKMLLATLKNNGTCPCPKCYVMKDQIHQLGTKADTKRRKNIRQDNSKWRYMVDRARDFVFRLGRKITGSTVERILKPFSWVPTKNAFHKIQEVDPDFNLFKMISLPDSLHEFEIGLFKAILLFILRLLEATSNALDELDQRFRRVPTFGRTTIRRFIRNVSETKQFAARDFEDVMQCILPVINGLFVDGKHDVYDALVQDVLFDLVACHAYAKLRLHTTSSLQLFRNSLTTLGTSLRRLQRETAQIVTVELPSEYQSRMRAKSRKAAGASAAPIITTTKLEKPLNINTPKAHLIGHYPDGIVNTGTTDGYSTQLCEASHRLPKVWYATRTNRRNVETQLATNEHRIRVAAQTEERMLAEETGSKQGLSNKPSDGRHTLPEPAEETLPDAPPRQHHQIGESRRTYWKLDDLPHLPGVPVANDPAYKDFGLKLKAHLRRRLINPDGDDESEEFTNEELNDVLIEQNRLYTHAIMHVNFTSYDMQRDQDLVNPRTHCNVMVAALDSEDAATEQPYLFARVLQIHHLDVRLRGQRPQRMEVLFVRYYQVDTTHRWGWKHKRLPRVTFLPHDHPDAFGFLDPHDVIRAVHLIPQFRYGRTTELLPRSIARQFDVEYDDDGDWQFYNVNWFVDRDMVMRFHKDAVGHRIVKIKADDPVPLEQEDGEQENDLDVETLLAELIALTAPAPEETEGEGDVGGLQPGEEDYEAETGRREVDEEDEGEPPNAIQRPVVALVGDEAALDAAGLDNY